MRKLIPLFWVLLFLEAKAQQHNWSGLNINHPYMNSQGLPGPGDAEPPNSPYCCRPNNQSCIKVNFCSEGSIVSPYQEVDWLSWGGDLNVSPTWCETVTYKANGSIDLLPGFNTGYLHKCSFDGYCVNDPNPDVVIIDGTNTQGEVGKHEKLEIGIRLPTTVNGNIYNNAIKNFFDNNSGTKINPYDPYDVVEGNTDPEAITVAALFTNLTTGHQRKVYGFFYRDYEIAGNSYNPVNNNSQGFNWPEYPFRVRFAPDEEGTWQVQLSFQLNPSSFASPEDNYEYPGCYTIDCIPSNNPGYLEKGNNNYYLRFHDTQQSFFGVGTNTAWSTWSNLTPMEFTNYWTDWYTKLKNNGANVAGITLVPLGGLDIEWEHLNVYDSYSATYGPGNRQIHAWEVDRIFNLAHDLDLYLKFAATIHHTNWVDECNGNTPSTDWDNDPYNLSIPGVDLPIEFFTNTTAKKMFKRKLRYMVSRWGYSTNILLYHYCPTKIIKG